MCGARDGAWHKLRAVDVASGGFACDSDRDAGAGFSEDGIADEAREQRRPSGEGRKELPKTRALGMVRSSRFAGTGPRPRLRPGRANMGCARLSKAEWRKSCRDVLLSLQVSRSRALYLLVSVWHAPSLGVRSRWRDGHGYRLREAPAWSARRR